MCGLRRAVRSYRDRRFFSRSALFWCLPGTLIGSMLRSSRSWGPSLHPGQEHSDSADLVVLQPISNPHQPGATSIMRVLMPSRFIDRHVGGNTTYARNLAAGLEARGIEVGRIPAARHPVATMALESIEGLRSGTRGDILHYVADTGPMLGTRRPTVLTVHGVASRWITVARRKSQDQAWRMRVQRAINAADHVITVSNSSADDVSEVFGVDRGRLTTIEHGVDLTRFSTPTALSPELAKLLPERFALYLGNIEPRKNLPALIKAFSAPEVRNLGIPLVIAGKPAWNSEEALAAIDSSPDVIRLGWVSDEDRVALMQSCTLFAFPSLYEGFGLPVIEALASGAVVLTSNRGSLAEVAGPSIRLVSLGAEAIADGLVKSLTDDTLRDECLRDGVTWASRFKWDTSVTKHLEIYQRLAR